MLLHLMALLLLVLAAAPASRAEERILSWHSDIVVERSGDLVVTETIVVRALGQVISGVFCGISRAFTRPSSGLRRRSPLKCCPYCGTGKRGTIGPRILAREGSGSGSGKGP